MTSRDALSKGESDVVAVFHASFHPTKGNVVDWCIKSCDDLELDGVEFRVLPSGLHVVERDVVYFSHSRYTGVAVFRRRPTSSHGHRGFRLSSLGILLRDSSRPRPWAHIQALQELADAVYASAELREERAEREGQSSSGATDNEGDLQDGDFAPAKAWFEEHRADKPSIRDTWSGWSGELEGGDSSSESPTAHLSHLLRILGLSSLTLYKFILARRRVLIVTLPPVEAAGILAWAAADMCLEHHLAALNRSRTSIDTPIADMFGAKDMKKPDEDAASAVCGSPRVLGMVSLNDVARLEAESATGRGWIACTTDSILMDKPSHYDLLIDLTVCQQPRVSGRIPRPAMYMTKVVKVPTATSRRGDTWKLESVRFTWSDLKLWAEVDRILRLDANISQYVPAPPLSFGPTVVQSPSPSSALVSRWLDAFQWYEDVCLLCASIWVGSGTWRSTNRNALFTTTPGPAGSWGAVRLQAVEDDWQREQSADGPQNRMRRIWNRRWSRGSDGEPSGPRLRLRSFGQTADRPSDLDEASRSPRVRFVTTPPKKIRRLSAHAEEREASAEQSSEGGETLGGDDEVTAEDEATLADERKKQNVQTTLALLQTFHSNTLFWVASLREIIPPPSTLPSPSLLTSTPAMTRRYQRLPSEAVASGDEDDEEEIVTLTARDVSSMELGILSDLDARFVEWLAEAEGYSGGTAGRKIIVKRTWQDVLGVMFGLR